MGEIIYRIAQMSHLWPSSPYMLWVRFELEMEISQASSFLYLLAGESSSFVGEIHAEGLPLPAETLELSVCAEDWSDLVEPGTLLVVALPEWLWLHPVLLLFSSARTPLVSCMIVKKHHPPWAWL